MRERARACVAKQRSAVAAMLRQIFAQDICADAIAQWDVVADALREKQRRLSPCPETCKGRRVYAARPASGWN